MFGKRFRRFKIAIKIYGANKVIYTPRALNQLKNIYDLGFSNFEICMAKTPMSFSDDDKKMDDQMILQ